MIAPAQLPADALHIEAIDAPLPDEAVEIIAAWLLDLAEAGEAEEAAAS